MPKPAAWEPEERDAIVIGATYCGMITAGLLAQAGMKTLVVDPFERIGESGGARPRNDYWVNYGHRDAVAMRQTTFQGTAYNTEAQMRLDAKLPLVGPIDPGMICHLPPSTEVTTLYGAGGDRLQTTARLVMGLADSEVDAFVEALGRLAQTPRAEAERLIPVKLKDWFATAGLSADVQRALLSYCDMIWSVPAEETSVGRLIISHLQKSGVYYHVSDPENPGSQGLITAYARRFHELGGETWCDQKPFQILVEDGKVAGVRMRDRSSFVREVRAPIVVFAFVAHQLFDIIDEGLFPARYVEEARSTKPFETPLLIQWRGLSEPPRIRATGAVDEGRSFHRLMFPGAQYGGGWYVISNCQQGTAPPGKHLMAIYYGKGSPFDESMEALSRTIAHAGGYYGNLDEATEWSEFQWVQEAHSMGWSCKTGDRASQRSPIPGLYLSGYTTDVEGIDYDADACGALRAADFAIADFGAKLGRAAK
jgi:phytoene dehydrogenase-like protein